MNIGGNTFQIKGDVFDRISHKISNRLVKDDEVMKKRITAATNMIWRIAHQRRAMLSKADMRAQGRSKRVSDPGATAGVPVQTGKLQGSIKQSVTKKGLLKYQGEVSTRGVDYSGYVEFGTSKMYARPFMRPAIWLTEEAIKRMMGLKVQSNL